MRKYASPIRNLLKHPALAGIAARVPKEVGAGWLPYLAHGTAGAAASAFQGGRGIVNAKRGILPAALAGGGAVGLDYAADGQVDHGMSDAMVALLGGAVPGARNAIARVGRRWQGNLKLVKALEAGGIQPQQGATDAMTELAQRTLPLFGKTRDADAGTMPLKDMLRNLFSTRNELRIGNLTNTRQQAAVTRKAMGGAVKRWGVTSMDAGNVQNPQIFNGLMEGDMSLRRALARMGYTRLRGHAAHSTTRDTHPELMEALLIHAVNKSRGKRFRAGNHSGMMPDYQDATTWLAAKGALKDRNGHAYDPDDVQDIIDNLLPDSGASASEIAAAKRLAKQVNNSMKGLGIRHEADWNHAADRALAAGTSYAGIDPSRLSYGKYRLPKVKDPSVQLPPKPQLDKLFDVDTPNTKFDVDLLKWMAERKAMRAPANNVPAAS